MVGATLGFPPGALGLPPGGGSSVIIASNVAVLTQILPIGPVLDDLTNLGDLRFVIPQLPVDEDSDDVWWVDQVFLSYYRVLDVENQDSDISIEIKGVPVFSATDVNQTLTWPQVRDSPEVDTWAKNQVDLDPQGGQFATRYVVRYFPRLGTRAIRLPIEVHVHWQVGISQWPSCSVLLRFVKSGRDALAPGG